eukprot:IDg18853t1
MSTRLALVLATFVCTDWRRAVRSCCHICFAAQQSESRPLTCHVKLSMGRAKKWGAAFYGESRKGKCVHILRSLV